MAHSSKGSAFEREICKILGLWWTGGKRDDVFWRTSNSGGRAKTRIKQGRETFAQYGDIQATDPIGQPLLDLTTIELKRGYGRTSVAEMLDAPSNAAKCLWQQWLEQAITDHTNAKTPFWTLITKRDRRQAVLFIPVELYSVLHWVGELRSVRPLIKIYLRDFGTVVGMQLADFLIIQPKQIIQLAKDNQ